MSWKVIDVTAVTILWTDWPPEPILCVVINSYIQNWILNVDQIIPLSEPSLFAICKMNFRCHLFGICDLEHLVYYHVAMLDMCFEERNGMATKSTHH